MTDLSLEYISRPSTLKENAPLLLLFHGYGSDENDLFSFASELPEEFLIISAKAPYPMQPFGNAWYAINFDAEKGKWSDNEQAKQSRDLIANFIDEILAKYNADSNNVTLLGFSQGAILSYAVAFTYPEKVKNVIALSGYVNPDLFELKGPETYKNLNFYCSHGSVDQVIPIDWARQTKPFMEQLGVNYKYSEFPVGHGVAPQNFYEFREWLKANSNL
ncbi:phospholipase/carboxylesterase [Mesoflavibacter sabulilitoris]|uniref:Phospholipase n=1 Tax=Mesoflavibacter zeaxanthinifaciens subsp. sabulilitoris TaxID=1520893 RepID=A0A2T1NGQ0_9FLAO|nr:alpha/beta hydrolase-fold protein [Mesoflavibacter zeaxanthinifaciens]MBB3122875.1 phospholipase/carboxylesterase [Mesoflavibacter zeaxanthinifaciens subsp. sabulilitoris]PSG92048.1 phospholipase [Mesoflavibacter zeaxanthinifaciens subsp. sabulilitoris]